MTPSFLRSIFALVLSDGSKRSAAKEPSWTIRWVRELESRSEELCWEGESSLCYSSVRTLLLVFHRMLAERNGDDTAADISRGPKSER